MPELIVEHIETLAPYLKGQNHLKSRDNEASLLVKIISTMSLALPLVKRPTLQFVQTVEKDLKSLVMKFPPAVMKGSIQCLATVADRVSANVPGGRSKKADTPADVLSAGPAATLFNILQAFYGFLHKQKDRSDFSVSNHQFHTSVLRSLIVVGLICRYYNFDKAVESEDDDEMEDGKDEGESKEVAVEGKLQQGTVTQQVYQLYQHYLRRFVGREAPKDQNTTELGRQALRGIGLLFISSPRHFLQAEQECKLLRKVFKESNEAVQMQGLQSCVELLEAEEERIETGSAKQRMEAASTTSSQVKGDQDADASILGSVLQIHLTSILERSFAKQAALRMGAIRLLGTMLRQGLVNPLQCIPHLVALEADHDPKVAHEAHEQILKLHEKHPQFVYNRALDGLKLSHSFQLKTFGSCKALMKTIRDEDQPVFARLYNPMLRANSKVRNSFLRLCVGLFDQQHVTNPDGKSGGSSAAGASDASGDSEAGFEVDMLNGATNGASLPPGRKGGKSKGKGKGKAKAQGGQSGVKSGDNVPLLIYMTQVLSMLPYDVQEEPLYLIHLINRQVSLQGSALDVSLKRQFNKVGFKPDEADDVDVDASEGVAEGIGLQLPSAAVMEELRARCAGGFAIGLLLKLKHFLKQVYCLNDSKCSAYSPFTSTSKANEKAIFKPDGIPVIELPEAPVVFVRKQQRKSKEKEGKQHQEKQEKEGQLQLQQLHEQFQCFSMLLKEDPADFTLSKAVKRAPRKRALLDAAEGKGVASKRKKLAAKKKAQKKKKKRKKSDDDSDEEDEDSDYNED
jgi:cohesin loading factor subunit SCC2